MGSTAPKRPTLSKSHPPAKISECQPFSGRDSKETNKCLHINTRVYISDGESRNIKYSERKLKGLCFKQGGEGSLVGGGSADGRPECISKLSRMPGEKPCSQGNPKYKGPEAKRKIVLSLSLRCIAS